MKNIFPILIFIFVATSTVFSQEFSGVYRKGHNVTEPRPKESKYLKVIDGGVVVHGQKAGLYLTVEVKDMTSSLYITATYPNPATGETMTNDMFLMGNPGAKKPSLAQLGSPDYIKGLKIYSDYKVHLKVYQKKGDIRPIDSLTQVIRSYVDTTGPKLKVFSKLKQR